MNNVTKQLKIETSNIQLLKCFKIDISLKHTNVLEICIIWPQFIHGYL